MPASEDVQEREAAHGEKMIEIKLRFWTDNIAPTAGHILPKHAWTAGVVRIERNTAHGIAPEQPLPFNSLLEVSAVIEQALIDHGIMLHASRKMQKYVSE